MVVDTKLYEILGVDPSANEAELKRAYKKMAIKLHPDKNQDDPEATEKFQALNEAYEILRDKEKRQLYDEGGFEGLKSSSPEADFGDILSHFFGAGSRPRSKDIEHELELTLEELYNGVEKTIKITRHVICPECHATGLLPDKHGTPCETCGGQGRVIMQRGMMQGVAKCPNCQGFGEIFADDDKCPKCHGDKLIEEEKTHVVHVEKGMEDGDHIVFHEAADEYPDADIGDVVVIVREQEHDRFIRNHDNLMIVKTINLSDALFGFKLVIPHLDGRLIVVEMTSDEAINSGSVIVVPNEGMPQHGNSYLKGKLFVQFKVILPYRSDISRSPEFKQILTKLVPQTDELADLPKDMNKDNIFEPELMEGTLEEFENTKKNKQNRQREAYNGSDDFDDEGEDDGEGEDSVGCAPM